MNDKSKSEKMMPESSNAHDHASVQIDDLEYLHASNVNVNNFVSVKLSGRENYLIWRGQMICLMRRLNMLYIVHDYCKQVEDMRKMLTITRYETLLEGWILGSINEEVYLKIYHCNGPQKIWEKLESLYGKKNTHTGSEDLQIDEHVSIKIKETADNNCSQLGRKLHDITLEGNWWKAKSILKDNKDAVSKAINSNGDTMLHLAVAQGKNYFITKLLNFIQDGKLVETRDRRGHTALHVAAKVGNTYAAKLLVKKRKELLGMSDYPGSKGIPMRLAYFYSKIDTFLYLLKATEDSQRSCIDDFNSGQNQLSKAIIRRQYGLALELVNIYPELATKDDAVLMDLTKYFPGEMDFGEALFYPSLNNAFQKIVERSYMLFPSANFFYTRAEDILWATASFENTYISRLLPDILLILLIVPIAVLYPAYQLIHLLILVLIFPFFLLYFLLWNVLAYVVAPIKHIVNKRKERKEAKELLVAICNHISKLNDSETKEIYKFPLLEATRLDTVEVVRQILTCSRDLVTYEDDGNNIVQIAVKNRSEKVYNLSGILVDHTLLPAINMTEYPSEDNLLHMAGRLAPPNVLSHTRGAALQLQRELQWREEMWKVMPPTQLTAMNAKGETPEMVFTREHADLVKEGEQWMKTTAESCSITAALIVTIVFAAAITVPGGNNQVTGIPLFRKDIAFIIFAVSDAISLFTATTSLLVFLSILTTRFAENDFLKTLPRRLIIGLCFLVLSTTAMMAAFSAILYLVFCEKKAWMLAPIGVLACLPLAAIVTLQLPLVVDLYQSTYSPRFGQKQKRRSSPYKDE